LGDEPRLERCEKQYASGNGEHNGQGTERANAAVFHDLENLLPVPSAAKGIG
jgi:hypothetical protein